MSRELLGRVKTYGDAIRGWLINPPTKVQRDAMLEVIGQLVARVDRHVRAHEAMRLRGG